MKIKFKVTPVGTSPGFIIHHLDLSLRLGLQKSIHAQGLNVTTEQWGILNCLGTQEGIHQSAIAENIGKDRHSVTRMLNLLEKNGLVRRVPTDKDKRRLNVFLTPSGREMQKKLVPIVISFLEEAFRGLTQEETDEFIRVLRHLTGNLASLKA